MNLTTVTVIYAVVGILAAAALHWRLGRAPDISAAQLHSWTLASLVFLPWFILYVLFLVILGLFTDSQHDPDSDTGQNSGC